MARDDGQPGEFVVNSSDQSSADLPPRERAPFIGRGMKRPAQEARRLVTVLIVLACVTFPLLIAAGIVGIVETRQACERAGTPVYTGVTRMSCDIGGTLVTMPTQASFLTVMFAGAGLLGTVLIAVVYRIVNREARRPGSDASPA